jgi:hypothetical protein
MYRCGVGLGPLKDVQGRESTSLCHVLIWPWHSEVDSRTWRAFNGPKPTLQWYMICTWDCIHSFNVLLMMGAESTRNMYSNVAVNNKDDCLKLHHIGYLINRVMMHGTTNIKFSWNLLYTGDTRLYLSHITGFLTENIHGFAHTLQGNNRTAQSNRI